MAGYFIVLGDIKDEAQTVIKRARDILCELCRFGMYSTNLYLSRGSRKWSKPKVATFADYYGMKANDYIFFFTERKIFGVGKLLNIDGDCKYWAYKGANRPKEYSEEEISDSRLNDFIKPENRCVCFFEPIEYYSHAIDMDEALTAFPDSFKSLRVIQNRTFIKLDDEEAMALFSVLHSRNASLLDNSREDWTPPAFEDVIHSKAREMIRRFPDNYRFSIESLLENYQCWNGNGIQEEMAIEAAVVSALSSESSQGPFDRMSYVSHQVSASPAKPVEYMEWMDVFGYSVSDYLSYNQIPVQLAINRYYVIEIKRDILRLAPSRSGRETASMRENKSIASQLMKYVDWVAKNYASGRYPMVKGVLIANGFDDDFITYCEKVCIRNYNDGYRNSSPARWADFELIEYSFDGEKISFNRVFPRDSI